MALSDIAAGVEVTAEQQDRGVAVVDDTDVDLHTKLDAFSDDLPCTAAAAATMLETYATGSDIGTSAREAEIAPVTAAKALHLLGVDGVTTLSPTGREVVRDWLDARLSRADAKELVGVDENEFALAVFVETHDALPGGREIVDVAFGGRGAGAAHKRDHLADTMSDVGDLR